MSESSSEELELAERLYREWTSGSTSKSQIEIREWDDATAHGRRFDRFIHKHLGHKTSHKSKQTERIAELERQLRGRGWLSDAASDWECQLQHGRQAALQALRVWNDPFCLFKTEAFSILLITAWNSISISILQKAEREWRQLDDDDKPVTIRGREKSLEVRNLVRKALPDGSMAGTRKNVEFWIDLRDQVAHRYLPATDLVVIPYAQAALLNFENVLEAEFGREYLLGDALSVPLQISGFRDPGILSSLKRLQAQLPVDVQQFLNSDSAIREDLVRDPTFMLRVAFVPVVPASGRSPDAVTYFVRPDTVDDELSESLEKYVVVPKIAKPPKADLGATEVVRLVQEEIPFRLNTNDHAKVARKLKVRPEKNAGDQSKTDEAYCSYFSPSKSYGYTKAWVARLIAELRTESGFRALVGAEPRPK